jgi:hypothetical protein
VYNLILILSLKTQFFHDLDIKVIPNLVSMQQCQALGKQLELDLIALDSAMSVKNYCETTR